MLYYEVYDNHQSKWVVFLHGFGGSTLTWKMQLKAFSDYNLLLIDLPGHGYSTNEGLVSVYGTNVLIKEVLDHLKIKKADFITLSLGSMVVTNFVKKYPSYVNSIIYGGASLKMSGLYKYVLGLVNMIRVFLPTRLMFKLLSKIILPKKNHEKSRQIFIRESLKMKRKYILMWLSYVWNAVGKNNIWHNLEKLDIEMLFVSGAEDYCFLNGAKDVANNLSNASLLVIDHCGHACTIEKHYEFNQIALDFLRQVHIKDSFAYV